MGRSCTVCTHSKRRDIDNHLLHGTRTLAELSQTYEVSVSATHRHRSAHLETGSIVALIRDAEGQEMAAGDLAFRLTNLMNDAALIRQTSLTAGNTSNALRAIQTEESLIRGAFEYLGTSEVGALRELKTAADVFRALGLAAKSDNEAKNAIIAAMQRMRMPDLAESVEEYASRTNNHPEKLENND